MTDRVTCTSLSCTNTILPSTAKRNNSVCAPCASNAAAEKYRAYVAANRTTVDRFDGVLDDVEYVWKLYNRPVHDDLVKQTPAKRSREEVWRQLSDNDVARVMKRLEYLPDDDEVREEIYDGLASFKANLDIDDELRRRLRAEEPYPGLLYQHASPALVAEMVELLIAKHDQPDANAFLPIAVAWCNGDVVENTLSALLARGKPAYGHVTYDAYLQSACWELSDGRRRALNRSACLAADKVSGSGVVDFKAGVAGDRSCPFCQRKMVHVFRWVADPPQWFPDDIDVVTCPTCVAFSEEFFVYTRGALQGKVHAKTTAEPPDDVWKNTPSEKSASYTLGSRRRAQQNVWWLATEGSVSQLGGMPTWIDDARHPKCPDCGETMTALLQLECAELWDGEGLLYVMDCDACSIAATLFQQT